MPGIVVVTLLLALLPAVVLALLVAAILNLPIPTAGKVLCFVVLWWGYVVIKGLADLTSEMRKVTMWARLGFISTEIQNERDGLGGRAIERLDYDEGLVRREHELRGSGETAQVVFVVAGIFFGMALLALLYFETLGDFGTATVRAWLDQLLT